MSTLAASESEPPQQANQPPPSSPTSSLSRDIVSEILARVPRHHYPILSCVSKNFKNLVHSPEFHRVRSLLGKDSVFICFNDVDETTYIWFTLRRVENNPTENLFVSIDIAFPYDDEPHPSVIAVGPEIFFICGSYIPSSSLWIFDTRSGILRQGPSMQVERFYKSVGLVGDKIYVIGCDRKYDVKPELFDLKTQTWKAAPKPEKEGSLIWNVDTNESVDKKIYGLCSRVGDGIVYDTRDGSCEYVDVPKDESWEAGVCAIDNVLYVYYGRFGLMWYDTEHKLWRVVNSLSLNKVQFVGLAEYYGKMVFLWMDSGEIWCRMIALDRSEEGIHGTAEESQLLGIVPCGYRLKHCLSLSG